MREAKALLAGGNGSRGGSHLASMVEMDHLDSTDANRLAELESESRQLKEANRSKLNTTICFTQYSEKFMKYKILLKRSCIVTIYTYVKEDTKSKTFFHG